MEKFINACGTGFCSQAANEAQVRACHTADADWNGKCAYQDGRGITAEQVKEGINLTCCEGGCNISASEFARWNGKCAHQGR